MERSLDVHEESRFQHLFGFSNLRRKCSSEEITKAKEGLKSALFLNIKTASQKGQTAIFHKAMDVLVKSQALSGSAYIMSPVFLQRYSSTKAYNASVQEIWRRREA